MATTKSNIHYKYTLIEEATGKRLMESRTIKAIKDYIRILLKPSGTKFIVERKVYQGKYLMGIYINYKQYQIA